MANNTETKQYLDAEGLQRLKQYIDDQINPLREAINLLNGNNETPGSISQMIDNAINDVTIINGGNAPKEGEP